MISFQNYNNCFFQKYGSFRLEHFGLLSWGQAFKTKIQQVLDYEYRIQKLISSVGKFSHLICKSPKKRVSSQGFYKNFVKILRNKFALEHCVVEAF